MSVSDFDLALSDESIPCPESRMGSASAQLEAGEILEEVEKSQKMKKTKHQLVYFS